MRIVVAGGAQDLPRQALARGGQLAVVAPEMRAGCAHLERQLDVVVDDHRHIVAPGEGDDFTRFGNIALLAPVLEQGGAALDGFLNRRNQARAV